MTSIHTALDALREIMRENKLAADDIAAVETGLSPMTHVHCAWEYKAQGVTAAQMNLFYGLAVIALDGVAFTDAVPGERACSDPKILDFIAQQRAYVDPEIEAMGAAFRHACAREGHDARRARVREAGAATAAAARRIRSHPRRSSTSSTTWSRPAWLAPMRSESSISSSGSRRWPT